MKNKLFPYFVLFFGVCIVSTAALIIRHLQAQNISSIAIAAVRLSFAALILSPFVLVKFKEDLRNLTKVQLSKAFFAGFFLAVHFGTWITSMEYTSVSSSAALVSTTPIWVAVFSIFIFKEKLAKYTAWGILVSIIGSGIIFLSDKSNSTNGLTNPFLGNSLALCGAAGMCFYLLIGRELSRQMNLWVYVWLVYGSAAFCLSLTMLTAGIELQKLPAVLYTMCLLLALGPQLLGHTSYNWSMRHLSPVFISIAILGEPVFTAILAGLFLNESLQSLQIAGFIILFIGIILALFGEKTT